MSVARRPSKPRGTARPHEYSPCANGQQEKTRGGEAIHAASLFTSYLAVIVRNMNKEMLSMKTCLLLVLFL